MHRFKIVVALIIFHIVFVSPQLVFAETTNENRTVAESLEDDASKNSDQTETPKMGEAEPNEQIGNPSKIEVEGETIVQQNPFLTLIKMVAALAFVIILIYFLLRFINKRSQSYRSTQMLQNIGGVPLGANRSVQIVKVGERVLIVGVGETIQLLKEIDNKEEVEQLLLQQEEQFEKFDQPINKMLQLFKGRPQQPKNAGRNANPNELAFKKVLENQLNDVKDSQKKLRDAVREREK